MILYLLESQWEFGCDEIMEVVQIPMLHTNQLGVQHYLSFHIVFGPQGWDYRRANSQGWSTCPAGGTQPWRQSMSPISDYMFLGFSFRPDRVVLSFTLAIKDLHASYVWRRRSMRGEVAKNPKQLKIQSNNKDQSKTTENPMNNPAQSKWQSSGTLRHNPIQLRSSGTIRIAGVGLCWKSFPVRETAPKGVKSNKNGWPMFFTGKRCQTTNKLVTWIWRWIAERLENELPQVKAGGTRPEVLDFSLGNITKPKVKFGNIKKWT